MCTKPTGGERYAGAISKCSQTFHRSIQGSVGTYQTSASLDLRRVTQASASDDDIIDATHRRREVGADMEEVTHDASTCDAHSDEEERSSTSRPTTYDEASTFDAQVVTG